MRWGVGQLGILLAVGLMATPAAFAAQIPVTTTADVVANDGQCSLREAVFAARLDLAVQGCPAGTAGEDTIQLAAATYDFATISGGTEDGNESGDLDTGPTSAIRVVGQGPGVTVIDAHGQDRVFDVFQGARLTLDGLTLRNGATAPGGVGGAVRNQGTLIVSRTAFEGNAAGDAATPPNDLNSTRPSTGEGGAIWSGGPASPSVLVADALFRGNHAGRGANAIRYPGGTGGAIIWSGGDGGSGGAIAIASGGAEISGTTFADNRAGDGGDQLPTAGGAPAEGSGPGGRGGALAAIEAGSISAVNSTFSGNRAGSKGAGYIRGRGEVTPEGEGGAAAQDGTGSLRISWSTFAGDLRGAESTGGNAVNGTNAQVSASVIAEAAPGCAVLAQPVLRNVVSPGDTSCGAASLAGDARLGPLAANGGPTPTLLPGAGSAAIDAIVGAPCPGTDQRGQPRPRLAGCDAGAVEVQPGEPAAAGTGRAGPAPVAPRLLTRRLSSLRLAPTAFRVTGRAPLGATLSFTLSAGGRVVITVQTAVPGRRAGRRCVAVGPRLGKARRCIRRITLPGRLLRLGTVGKNTIHFGGTLRGKALPAGRYTLVVTLPRAGAAPAVAARTGFTILG